MIVGPLSRLLPATIPAAPDDGRGPACLRRPTARQQHRQNAVVSAVRRHVMPQSAAVGCGAYRAADHQTAPGAAESARKDTVAADHAPVIDDTNMT